MQQLMPHFRSALTLALVITTMSAHGMESSFAEATADRSSFAHPPSRETLYGVMSRRSETKTDKQNDNPAIDYPELSPISLAQTYHYFSHDEQLPPEITRQIFFLHLRLNNVDFKELQQSCKDPSALVEYIKSLINSCGYPLASELCERFFSGAQLSICDIKDSNHWTSLHRAANNNRTESVKLLLNAAGDKAGELLAMQNNDGETAFNLANAQTKEIMRKYMTTGQQLSMFLGNCAYNFRSFKEDLYSMFDNW